MRLEIVAGQRETAHGRSNNIRVRRTLAKSFHSRWLFFYLVSAQYDRDVLADPCQVSVPVGYVLVRDAAGNVEHDDCALPLDADEFWKK